jgi:hypothetical protein
MIGDVRYMREVPVIVIAEDTQVGGDEADAKRVKTEAGERFVPVPSRAGASRVSTPLASHALRRIPDHRDNSGTQKWPPRSSIAVSGL